MQSGVQEDSIFNIKETKSISLKPIKPYQEIQ